MTALLALAVMCTLVLLVWRRLAPRARRPADRRRALPEFVAADRFDGCRPYYVFKASDDGRLGYHLDAPHRAEDVNRCARC